MNARFLRVFGLTLVAALGAIAVLNLVVNPYALYPSRFFPPLTVNDLDRSLQELAKPEAQPELVVFGSSRSARLQPPDLECYSGMVSANQAYSGSTPGGVYALASYLVDNKPTPKLFIIGVDVEGFNPEASFADTASHVTRLQKYLAGSGQLESLWQDYSSLLSIGQLSDTLGVLRRAAAVQVPRNPLDKLWVDAVTTLLAEHPALQRMVRRAYKTRTPKNAGVALQLDPDETKQVYQTRFRQYKELSPEEKTYFESLLRLAQDHGIQVKLFITTLHPSLIQVLNKQGNYPKRHAEVVSFLEGLKSRYAFEFYDFSTPDTFGGNNEDFFNLAHIDEKNSARLIAALFSDKDRGAACGQTAR